MVAALPLIDPILKPTASTHTDGATNGIHELEVKPLHVVIVGAGIGGLVAAIALRREGHNVTILEQWDGGNETGAAIHLAPNANGILRRLGLFAESFGANAMNSLSEYSVDGSQIRFVDLTEPNKRWQHPWQLVHRVHLHRKLSQTATQNEGKGKPANLRYSCKVVDVDSDSATVILQGGEQIHGDVVLGADGVYSNCRKKVKGGKDVTPFSSGKSAFRFLISRQAAVDDERTKKFAVRDGDLSILMDNDRKIVIYPCQDNTLLNFVCIHPDSETSAPDDSKLLGLSQDMTIF